MAKRSIPIEIMENLEIGDTTRYVLPRLFTREDCSPRRMNEMMARAWAGELEPFDESYVDITSVGRGRFTLSFSDDAFKKP